MSGSSQQTEAERDPGAPGPQSGSETAQAEASRLAALHAYGIMDTPPEAAFDRITRLAARILEVPMAVVSLVDKDRQWFKARCGIEAEETPRAIAFCDHTIRTRQVMVVEDAAKDARFADNPLVTGDPGIRFYAGAPLIMPSGDIVGALCVLDRKPRGLTPREAAVLGELAELVVHELSVRLSVGDAYNEVDAALGAKRQLANSRREFEALLNAAGSAAVTFDPQGRILSWNTAAEQLFGYPASAARGMLVDSILPRPHLPARPNAAAAGTGAWLHDHEPQGMPVVGRRRDGTLFPAEVTRAQWRLSTGEECAGAIISDATERRRADEELRRSRSHLRDAQRIGGIGSWDWHVPTSLIKLSDEMCHLVGLPEGTERRPADALAAIHPDDRSLWQGTMDRRIRGEHVPAITYRTIQPGGEIRFFQSVGQLVQQDDGPHLIGVVRDITDHAEREAQRAQQEEDLRRSQMHLAEAQRVGGIGSWDWNVRTGAIVPTEEMRKLIGLPPGSDRTMADARASAHPEDRDAWQEAMNRLAAGESVWPFIFRMIRPDGSIRAFQVSGQRVDYADGPHVIGVLKDVTEGLQREAERRETEKLAALGQLAGGVAHEINNLLQPIISLSELVAEDLNEVPDALALPELRANLGVVMHCGRDAREIVRKILRYARQETPQIAPTDIVETLTGAVALVRELLSPGVTVSLEIAPGTVGLARMNGAEMTQVITNLAVNADHAMKGQGSLRISLSRDGLAPIDAAAATVEPGDYFVLRVADTGCGMDDATRARSFDPFFTTKPIGQGTGLGLSMVQGILKSWKGAIGVTSRPGEGTEFRLLIPAADQSPTSGQAGIGPT